MIKIIDHNFPPSYIHSIRIFPEIFGLTLFEFLEY